MSEQEIDKIDKTLDQLDDLLKQLPADYQRDYAIELCDRFDIKLRKDEQ